MEKLVGNPTKKWAYDIQPAQAQVEQEPSVEYHVMVGLRHSTKLKIFLWCVSDTKTNNCETTSKRSFFDLHIKKDLLRRFVLEIRRKSISETGRRWSTHVLQTSDKGLRINPAKTFEL